MSCNIPCRLCNRLIISTSVTFTGGNLIITIPAGSYQNCCEYCIVVAQSIPAATTINAPVFIQIGTGTVLYPLNKCDCSQATACSIRTRTKYRTRLITTPTSGTFRLLDRICCAQNNNLLSVNGTIPVTDAATVEVAVAGIEGGNIYAQN